ncbi:HDOD domain-containing protein [Caldimonas sp. KR1-144]|uniref:HDOD domain-containing protein n=1 Tax=Caldimonas sp. KR1-144 TaxID=3400911 RepID=UPI003C0F01E3
MLNRPPTDLDAWTACFRDQAIPVLERTTQELALLREAEARHGSVDAHQLGETLRHDPLMQLRVLAHVAALARGRAGDDERHAPETVIGALVLLGVGPFFRAFEELPTVEARLATQPQALEGLRRVIRRAHRAATFALGFAVHRMDEDAPQVHLAASLHDFAEMLLWCHAPALALEIERRQSLDATLRSVVVQREVLGIELGALEQALMQAWSLPELLRRMTDDRHADHPQVRSVALAVRLARHSEAERGGWNNAGVPADLAEIGELLNLSPDATLSLVRSLDD